MDNLPMEQIVDEATQQTFRAMLNDALAPLRADMEQYVNTAIEGIVQQRKAERLQEAESVSAQFAERPTLKAVEALITAQDNRWRTNNARMIDLAFTSKLRPLQDQFASISTSLAALTGAVQTRLSDRDDGLQRAERLVRELNNQSESRFSRLDNLITELQLKHEALVRDHKAIVADLYGDPTLKDGQPSIMGTLREISAQLKAIDKRIETIERENEQRRQLMQRLVGAAKNAPRWMQIVAGVLGTGGIVALALDWLNRMGQ